MKPRNRLFAVMLLAVATLILASCAANEPVKPRPGLNQTSTGEVVAPLPWAGNKAAGTSPRLGDMDLAPDRRYYR